MCNENLMKSHYCVDKKDEKTTKKIINENLVAQKIF